MKGLLYTKMVVFHPHDLVKAGVHLSRVAQTARTMVTSSTSV